MIGEKALLIKRPYAVVDAAVSYFLSGLVGQYPSLIQRWQARSAGSSLHRMDGKPREGDAFVLWAIEARAAGLEQTAVTLFAGQALREDERCDAILSDLLLQIESETDRFDDWIARLDEARPRPAKGELQEAIKRLAPKPRPRGGAPTKDYNDRARARLAAGEDRETVYRDWLKDRGEDETNPGVRSRWRDAFRKAISRKDGRT